MNSKKILGTCLLVLVAGLLFSSIPYIVAQTDDLWGKLQTANTSIEQAYDGILSAEKAGANVTGLLEQLNVATGLLAQAENSYRTGDTSAAANYADQAVPIAQQVKTQATVAKNSAVSSKQNDFIFTVVFVIIGSQVFLLVLLFVWRRVKKRSR